MKPNHLILTFALLVLVGSLVACSSSRRRGGESCSDSSQCASESGELEACVAGYCESVECLSSSDCPMDHVCDVETNDYACDEGCNSDLDCRAGKTCVDGDCLEYGCRSTVLDCPRGEVCDLATGECEAADGMYCTECNLAGNEWDLGETTACDDDLIGNVACGGDGSYCLNYFGTPTCFVSCEEQEDCPAGYVCQNASWGLPLGCTQDYILLEKVCLSDCVPG
jgi:hypothetical protein